MHTNQQSAGLGLATRDLTLCGLFSALIAVGAFIKISIPVQPVPMHFTLQWFFVLMAGFLLGARQSFISVCTYLAVGLVGIPVFASGGGPAYLIRPTFGFLLGFAAAAWIIGVVCQRIRPVRVRGYLIPALAGLAVYYAMGMIYFYLISNYVILVPVGWKLVLVNCCLLTISGDVVLCVLAAALASRIRRAFSKIYTASGR